MSFFTWEFLTRLITSALGSCAFALIFKTDKRHLPMVSISGFVTYLVYHTVSFFGGGFFVASFASTLFAAVFGEVCARVFRAPTILYLVTGLIPIVPGGEAYYAMRYLLERNTAMASAKLLSTGSVALGIASGIVLVSIIVAAWADRKKQIHITGDTYGKYKKDI